MQFLSLCAVYQNSVSIVLRQDIVVFALFIAIVIPDKRAYLIGVLGRTGRMFSLMADKLFSQADNLSDWTAAEDRL